MTTTHRNIHAIPPRPDDDCGICADLRQSADLTLPRLRQVTNDPQREYAMRAGQVEPLPDNVAALILCRKGWSKIERQQIKITLDGAELLFASRESLTIAEHNGTGRRFLWVLNRRAPDVLHILTDDGAYVESIPRKGEAVWFDQGEASRAAYRDAKAMLQRDFTRMRELHAPDTAAAAADTAYNAGQVRRLVQTFPQNAASRTGGAEPSSVRIAPSPAPDRAEAIAAAMENVDAQRGRYAETAATRQNAARFGEVVRRNTTPSPEAEASADEQPENWADEPTARQPATPEPNTIESW
jgi:hypothetical protein